MGKSILVTGAAGFIGSHLCEKLLSLGYQVLGVDNLSVGRMSNLKDIDSRSFHFIEIDVNELHKDLLPAEFTKLDYIFHLAAMADIVPSITNPEIYFESNVRGTLKILELARRLQVKKFVYTASSSCYGIPSVFPTPESAAISPEYPYALTKFLGEELVMHWSKVYKIPSISLRFFNVFGPRARTSGSYGAVFGVFLAQKKSGQPLTVVGDGNQTRDFTYVTDVIDALIVSAESNIKNQIFNVGSGGTYAINHLVDLLGGEVVNIPKRPGEPDCTFGDISKIGRMLGWKPRVSFEEGVKNMLENLETWKDAPIWTPEMIEKETKLWFQFLGKE